MFEFNNLNLKQKLLIAFLLVGVIPFAAVGLISLYQASNALEQQSFNQLEAVRGTKQDQIHRFFDERHGDMNVLAETSATLRQESFKKLIAVRDNKKGVIEYYFNTIRDQVTTLAESPTISSAMSRLTTAFSEYRNQAGEGDAAAMQSAVEAYYTSQFGEEYKRQNGAATDSAQLLEGLDADSIALQYAYIANNPHPLGEKHRMDTVADRSDYSAIHQEIHPVMRSFLEKFGYYDIFLVDLTSGDIVYSVFKELDYSTSLINGPYAETNFGEAFRKAATLQKGEYAFVDYRQYRPSYDAPASFIASPVFQGEEKVGVLIFQMPMDRITAVMSERAGLGETGETYLVGGDLLMRSDSYLDPTHHSVVASFRNPEKGKVDTAATHAALAGKHGFDVIIDYNNNPVLSAYAPIDILGKQWAILSEVDVAEAFVPVITGSDKDYYARYLEEYGYYDLFLINPDGYIFYTVTKEADYQTNLLNGPYKDSNLGRLFRQVVESKQYGIADFEPYAPSNGDPAAFIANPIIHDGKVEMVVALQLSLDGINAIMGQRDGMGETGESYLVGSDLLMRSDSYLDPDNHSVVASFRNPEKGKVDTTAARAALAGNRGSEIIIDYNGNPVLSAYTPVQIGEITWGLLAEIDQAEAFSAVNTLQTLMLIVGLIGLTAIITVGWLMARSIVTPVTMVTNLFRQLEESGDFSLRCERLKSKDEIGEMSIRINALLSSLQEAIANANQVVTEVAKGNFALRMEGSYKGDLVTLKEGVNGSADSVETTMSALEAVMHGLGSGDLSVRMSDDVEEQFRNQVNGAMSSIDEVLQEVGSIIQRLSEGDFNARMTTQAEGDLKKLSDNINIAMEDLQTAITEVVNVANRMGEGDLQQTVKGEYQGSLGVLKTSINGTQQNIEKIVMQVRNTAHSVKNGAQEVSKGSTDLSSRTSEQAASLEETAASMEEMSSTVRMNADNANQASQLAAESLQRALDGAKVAGNAVLAMEGINESSNKIAEIITMIDSIAFQTNLLALNAAVEAARAGEHGRGFAVVAGEVRTLAQRSAEAAKDIKSLIEDSTTRIQDGSELVVHSGDALEVIQESVKKLNDIAAEIAAAAREQTQGIDQVNTVLTQMDSMTQENAALVEESAAASSTLTERANDLTEMVSVFKLSQ